MNSIFYLDIVFILIDILVFATLCMSSVDAVVVLTSAIIIMTVVVALSSLLLLLY